MDYLLHKKEHIPKESKYGFVFIGAKIGPEEAFYLCACGPDFMSIMPCKYGKTITENYKYIDKEILQCELIKEFLMTKREVDTGPLIVSM